MKPSSFLSKLKSKYLWGNLLAMLIVVVALCAGMKFGLDHYTHHGEAIPVPDVRHKTIADARHILEGMSLRLEVGDTGYVKMLPSGCVLEQSIAPGNVVKSGRTVRVTINSTTTPTLTIPDVIDNNSYREARAKLMAMGFRVGSPQYMPGERDWVYGITVRGVNVVTGQRVSVDDILIIQVGDGMRDVSDTVYFTDQYYEESDSMYETIGGEDIQGTETTYDDFEIMEEL